jgi:phage-related protein
VHHPRQRAVSFTYSDFDTAFDSLVHDVETLFFASDYPKVTYDMSLANLKNDPRYAEFLRLQDYHYGDSGSIYCPELDIDTVQKIVAEQRDELTGDVLRMTLGNLKNSWVRPSLLAETVSSGSTVEDKQRKALQEELKKTKLKALPDWKSARTYTWAEIRQFTWKELKNHGN